MFNLVFKPEQSGGEKIIGGYTLRPTYFLSVCSDARYNAVDTETSRQLCAVELPLTHAEAGVQIQSRGPGSPARFSFIAFVCQRARPRAASLLRAACQIDSSRHDR